jgi:hypothetical protein
MNGMRVPKQPRGALFPERLSRPDDRDSVTISVLLEDKASYPPLVHPKRRDLG